MRARRAAMVSRRRASPLHRQDSSGREPRGCPPFTWPPPSPARAAISRVRRLLRRRILYPEPALARRRRAASGVSNELMGCPRRQPVATTRGARRLERPRRRPLRHRGPTAGGGVVLCDSAARAVDYHAGVSEAEAARRRRRDAAAERGAAGGAAGAAVAVARAVKCGGRKKASMVRRRKRARDLVAQRLPTEDGDGRPAIAERGEDGRPTARACATRRASRQEHRSAAAPSRWTPMEVMAKQGSTRGGWSTSRWRTPRRAKLRSR